MPTRTTVASFTASLPSPSANSSREEEIPDISKGLGETAIHSASDAVAGIVEPVETIRTEDANQKDCAESDANEIQARPKNYEDGAKTDEVSYSPMGQMRRQDESQEETRMENRIGDGDGVSVVDSGSRANVVNGVQNGSCYVEEVASIRGGETENFVTMEAELNDENRVMDDGVHVIVKEDSTKNNKRNSYEVTAATSNAAAVLAKQEREVELNVNSSSSHGRMPFDNNCNQRNGSVEKFSTEAGGKEKTLPLSEKRKDMENVLSSGANPLDVRGKDNVGTIEGTPETKEEAHWGSKDVNYSNNSNGQQRCTAEETASEFNTKRKLEELTLPDTPKPQPSNVGNFPNTLLNDQEPTPKIAKTNYSTTYYPSISLTRLRSLKWAHCRDLMVPFLSESQKKNIHKRTRAELSEMVEKKVVVGAITPERFWNVVGLDKVRNKSGDGGGGADVVKVNNYNNSTFPSTNPPTHPAPTLPSGMPPHPSVRPYLYPHPRNIVSGHAHGPIPPPRYHGGPPPPHSHTIPPPQPPKPQSMPPPPSVPNMHPKFSQPLPQHTAVNSQVTTRNTSKYTLNARNFWATDHMGYPAGILLGEPNPPTPQHPHDNNTINTSPTNNTKARPLTTSQTTSTVQGIFHSSGIPPVPTGLDHFLAIKKETGRDKCKINTTIVPKVEEDLSAEKQCHFLFSKLEMFLNLLCCKRSDVFWVNLQIVDVHLHGREVLDIFRNYFSSGKKGTEDAKTGGVALNFVGVAGLLHEGALVQMEFRAVVRRCPISLFVLDQSGVPLATL